MAGSRNLVCALVGHRGGRGGGVCCCWCVWHGGLARGLLRGASREPGVVEEVSDTPASPRRPAGERTGKESLNLMHFTRAEESNSHSKCIEKRKVIDHFIDGAYPSIQVKETNYCASKETHC